MNPRARELIGSSIALSAIIAAGGCYGPDTPVHYAGVRPGITAVEADGLEPPYLLEQSDAWVDPPTGWRIDKFDVDAKHSHVVWLSPTRDTAYGVVMMNLPFPVGPDIVLWGFLQRMAAADKRADLLSKERAPELPGFRFVAESGLYRIRVNLTVHDWRAWAVYAGSLRDKAENTDELDLAEQARDRTRVAVPMKFATPTTGRATSEGD